MALLHLNKRFHPDFIKVGKKPLGPVEVDKEDLGNYLTFATLLSSNNLSDLVTGSGPTSIVDYVQEIEGGNTGFATDGTAPELDYSTQALVDVTKPFTLMFKCRLNAVTNNDALGTLKSASTSSMLLLFESSLPDFHWGGPSSGFSGYQISFSPAITDLHTYQICYNGEGDVKTNFRAFLDGVEVTVDDGVTVSASNNVTVIGNRQNGNLPHSGFIEYLFVFNKDLSAVGSTLHRDVYRRVLKPSTPLSYSTASGVAPTGRIMSSLAYNGGLAGSGGIAGSGGGLAG